MSNERVAGVYLIRNISNQKIYVGSSVDIKGRFVKHKSRLNRNKMGSKEFQEDWNNASNKSIFELEVVEILDNSTKEQLFEREQFYLDLFKSQGVACYNHAHNTKGGNGQGELHPFYGRPVPEKTKGRISDTLTGRELTDEHRKNIGLAQVGHNRITKEVAEKIAQKNRKLSDEEVIDILNRIKKGQTLKSIHDEYENIVSYSTIKGIKNGAAYSHIQRI